MQLSDRKLVVLGSTGSIGRQTLEVARHLGFQVVGLVAGRNAALLAEQIDLFRPQWAVLYDGQRFSVPAGTELAVGMEALDYYSRNHGGDLVVAAISGIAGLRPTFNAVQSGAIVALANKEALVTAGPLMLRAAERSGAKILPVDSEHSALWQCLQGVSKQDVERLILTASGGAFRDWPVDRLQHATVRDALAHPTWSMGNRLTIDSATLMNKGLEIIEAHWLFGVPFERISVVVHSESIVHSLVELVDGSLLAQLSQPDMRLPIQLALTYPERVSNPWPRLDLAQLGRLSFSEPRHEDFPALKLAIGAGMKGQSYPIVLNAANEVAVQAFAEGRIPFTQIPVVIEEALCAHSPYRIESVNDILEVDQSVRNQISLSQQKQSFKVD